MITRRVRSACVACLAALGILTTAVPAAAQTPLPAATAAPAAATAPQVAVIAGVVLDQSGGLPIAGVRLGLLLDGKAIQTTTSDRNGRFSFGGVLPGVYAIDLSAKGYASARSETIAYNGTGAAKVTLTLSRVQAASAGGLKTIAHTSTRASGLQTTTTIQQQVSPQLMTSVGQIRVAEGLGELPGVNLIGLDSAVGDDISVDIRGLKPSETQVLLDGHPIGPLGVYPSRIGGGTGGFDYQDAPLFALQNTVVTYGSGAEGLYGVDAVGGSVDFQTLNPSLTPELDLQYGGGGAGKQLFAAEATGTNGKVSYVLLHGVTGTYGDFPGATIAQTGARGNDFTSSTLNDVTYFVTGNYDLRNDLGKLSYAFSPATNLTLTGYSATSWDDKTGNGDNDFVTYDYALYQAQTSSNCTTGSGVKGITVKTNSGSQCFSPSAYAQNASGPAGGGPGAFQALANQDYHARFTTNDGPNQIVLDSFLDNYSQNRERPESFLNGPTSILNIDYRTIGTLASDDIALNKHDVGFGIYSQRQYTDGDTVIGSNKLLDTPVFNRLTSFFARDVYTPGGPFSFFLNTWMKHSNVGGSSFDPRVSMVYRADANDVFRVTGGDSSADPAPLPPQLTGPGGINPGNCQTFSVGEAQSPTELPEKAADLELSLAHRFSLAASGQIVAYDTNETNTIFAGNAPASDFSSLLNSAGSNYLPSVFARIESICPNFAPPHPAPTINDLYVATNLNLAKARARGLELSGEYHFTRGLVLQGYYDIQSSVVFDAPVSLLQDNVTLINGSQLPRIPLHKFGATLDYTNTHGGEVYLNYTHFDGNNPLNRPAYGVANAAFIQNVSKTTSINVGITNLFNNAVDNYGRIGWGVFTPENIYGPDSNGLQQGSEEFGLAPMTVQFSISQRIK